MDNGAVGGRVVSKWRTAKETAAHLHVHLVTVYRLLGRGEIPGHRVGSDWRFDLDEVDAWVRSRRKTSVERARA